MKEKGGKKRTHVLLSIDVLGPPAVEVLEDLIVEVLLRLGQDAIGRRLGRLAGEGVVGR